MNKLILLSLILIAMTGCKSPDRRHARHDFFLGCLNALHGIKAYSAANERTCLGAAILYENEVSK